jgi:hypothetical protein
LHVGMTPANRQTKRGYSRFTDGAVVGRITVSALELIVHGVSWSKTTRLLAFFTPWSSPQQRTRLSTAAQLLSQSRKWNLGLKESHPVHPSTPPRSSVPPFPTQLFSTDTFMHGTAAAGSQVETPSERKHPLGAPLRTPRRKFSRTVGPLSVHHL